MVEQMQLKAYAKGGPSVESSFSCLSFITRRYCYICCIGPLPLILGTLFAFAIAVVWAGGYTTLYTAVMLLKTFGRLTSFLFRLVNIETSPD